MERGSQIRVIGNASEQDKEELRVDIDNVFHRHAEHIPVELREKFEQYEIPKSEQEITLIQLVNIVTDELMKEYGIDSHDVPLENYHIIPQHLYKELAVIGQAMARWSDQAILFNADHFRENPVYFGSVAFHETLHMKSYLSLEMRDENDAVYIKAHRKGVVVGGLLKDAGHAHFEGLGEAIISHQQKKFTAKLLSMPGFEHEKEWLLSDTAMALKKQIAEKNDLSDDDIVWVRKDDPGDWEGIGYKSQRKVLEYVCEEIQKEFPDRFATEDDVFKEFLKAHFTGRLLPIARLVEQTFGEGSFRLLGNMGVEQESGILHLESLRKSRSRVVRTHNKKVV